VKTWIKRALTRRISLKYPRGRKEHQIEVPPSERLVYGIYVAIAALISLTILETVHIIVLKSFSTEIFTVISGLIGAILGVFFGYKG
jgi:hypothetical protein